MNNAVLNVKTDPATKRQLKKFAAELGLPVSALINAQIKQMLREQKVELGIGLEPTSYLQELIKEAEADYKAEQGIVTIDSDAELDDFFKNV